MATSKGAKPVPVIGSLIMSGHCSFPQTTDPFMSHERCARNGGGSRANPQKVFTPCPCPCHYGETFECGGCGRPIREALCWPFDEDGDMRYTHIDKDGRASGEDCSGAPVSRNAEVEEEEEDEPETIDEAVLDMGVIDLQVGWDALTPEERDSIREQAVFIEVPADPEPEDEEDEWDDMLAEFDLDD